MKGDDKFKVFLLWVLIIILVVFVVVVLNGTSDFAYAIRDALNLDKYIHINSSQGFQ